MKPVKVSRGTIIDVNISLAPSDKPIKEIRFATETNEVEMAKRTSFVREVYSKDGKPLSEVDLLALRGQRVVVEVYPDYWVVYPMEH